MWNWASGKEASSLVSSIHNKLVGAVPQTFLNWVILFLRLLILRYPTTGLLVHNVLKFVSSSMSRLWFVFLTLSLFWLVTLSRCFLKSALKELILFALVWKKCYWVKNCVEIFGKCDRMILMILFSDAVALLHIIISEYLIKFLVNCKILLPFKCNPLLLRWLLLVFPFSVMPICNLRRCDWISPIFIAKCFESVLVIGWDITICVVDYCSAINDFNSNSWSWNFNSFLHNGQQHLFHQAISHGRVFFQE